MNTGLDRTPGFTERTCTGILEAFQLLGDFTLPERSHTISNAEINKMTTTTTKKERSRTKQQL
ncbi:hypothetical protein TDB9533_03596 [Thalassocella blandensis]|nr:hypothetical protein TDB9533_03596 [Thalassocella blandensis]